MIFDAKYKVSRSDGRYPNADHYQMLAYCTALKVPRAWLVYAQGGAGPVVRRIVNTDVSVVEYPLDLRAEPEDLLRQMDVLTDAAWLAAGRQPSPLDATGHTTGPSRPIDPTGPRPTPNAEVASTDLPSSKTTVVSPPAGVDGADESSAGEWQSLLENAVSDQERALGADQGHDPSTA